MNSRAKCQELSKLIESQIDTLIDNDYIFLDLPYYNNIGDVLIWEGTEQLLSRLPYKCLYKTSASNFEYRPLDENTWIIFQGGGNFGDLYDWLQAFRRKILRLYPNNRVLMLPQTMYYTNWQHLRNDYIDFAQHKHLTLCARDLVSYRMMKFWGLAKTIRLLPDMAFCIDTSLWNNDNSNTSNRILLVKRIDKELCEKEDVYAKYKADDIEDWPTNKIPDRVVEELRRQLLENPRDREAVDKYADCVFRQHMIEVGVRFLSKYNEVRSTRLHAAILSILLGKKITILDNSYGKNSTFYQSWLTDVEGVTCESVITVNFFSVGMLVQFVLSRLDWIRIQLALGSWIKKAKHHNRC